MVQRMAATAQRAEQVTIRELELGAGSVLPGTQASLVGGCGGAEVRLDGEQMGIVYRIKTDSGGGSQGLPPLPINSPCLWGVRQESRGRWRLTCFAGLDADRLEA